MVKHFFSIQNEFIRFVLVGVLNTAFGYGIYCLLIFVRFPYWWAVLISNIYGVLFNFKTTGVLVFKSHNNRLVFRFIANYVVIFFINIGIVKMVLKYSFLNEYIAGIIAMSFCALLSYVFLKFIVFKTSTNEKN